MSNDRKTHFDEADVEAIKNANKQGKQSPTILGTILGLLVLLALILLVIGFVYSLDNVTEVRTDNDTATVLVTVTPIGNLVNIGNYCYPEGTPQPLQLLVIDKPEGLTIGRVGYRWIGYNIDHHLFFGNNTSVCGWPQPTKAEQFFIAIEMNDGSMQYFAADSQAPRVNVRLLQP